MKTNASDKTRAVYRRPLWLRLLQAFTLVLLGLLTLFVVVMTVAIAAGESWGVAIFFGVMSWALIPIFTFMVRETRASWRWRLDIVGSRIHPNPTVGHKP